MGRAIASGKRQTPRPQRLARPFSQLYGFKELLWGSHAGIVAHGDAVRRVPKRAQLCTSVGSRAVLSYLAIDPRSGQERLSRSAALAPDPGVARACQADDHSALHPCGDKDDPKHREPLRGLCCTNQLSDIAPLSQTDSSHRFCDGDATCGVAIQDRDTHLNLRDLAVEVTRHEALTQQFHAMHPLPGSGLLANHERVCLDATSAVVSAPIPPQRPTQVLRCAERVVSSDGTGSAWFLWLGVLARRADRSRTAVSPSRACKHALPGSGWRCDICACRMRHPRSRCQSPDRA